LRDYVLEQMAPQDDKGRDRINQVLDQIFAEVSSKGV